MKALILAAGYATRLYPLTKHFPKPLLTVGKKPLINYILDELTPIEGLDEIIVVTNSRYIGKFRVWAKGVRIPQRLSLVDDLTRTNEDRRGAIGDMVFTIRRKRITDDLLIVGGDNLFTQDMRDFFVFARQHPDSPVIGAYDIRSRLNARKYGVLSVAPDKRITRFQEKPEHPASTIVGMCLYYFPKKRLKLIDAYVGSREHKSDAMGFYIAWLAQRSAAYAYIFKGKWYDIGDHVFYQQAQRWVKKHPASNKGR
jgi:glucose-1-phosphate thymidylyltransferase